MKMEQVGTTYSFTFNAEELPPSETPDEIERAANGFLREGCERKYAQEQATVERLVEFAKKHMDISLEQFNALSLRFGWRFNLLPFTRAWNVEVDFSSIKKHQPKKRKCGQRRRKVH